MAAKRTHEESEDLATEDVEIMTADMADELRATLIEQRRRKTKKRLRTGPGIGVNSKRQTHGTASFFGLPQELRDEVYKYLWEQTPLIGQQYLQRHYTITYGERHDLLSRDVESGTAAWLLTSKQMMMEGFAAFHRRSIWISESWSTAAKSSYVFPLMTPARVHEQHLYVSGTSRGWHGPGAFRYRRIIPRLMLQHFHEEEIVTPGLVTMGLVNVMTTSTDSEAAVRKVKLYIKARGAQVFRVGSRPLVEYEHGIQLFDYSKLDRLAVHRKLRTLEVDIRVPIQSRFHDVERLRVTVENLITELKNVGRALVPGGTATEVDTEVGWRLGDGVNCFRFRVDKI